MDGRLDVIWDMETGDPDDFLTLLLLLGHPRVNLRAVTVTPGTPDQIGVVRAALAWFDRSLPVGAYDLEHRPRNREVVEGRSCVSAWHYAAYGEMPPSREAVPAPELLRALCGPETTLVTGGPLKNLGAALKLPGFTLGRLVVQGGFAGEGVVPSERQLPKFRGMRTCPTYNLNGDPRSAEAVLASRAIGAKQFVSKNVCHGVIYDARLHARVEALRDRRSLALIWKGMERYLGASRRRGREITAHEVRLVGEHKQLERVSLAEALARAEAASRELVALNDEEVPVCKLEVPASEPIGKKFHDPLAACCAIDPGIASWAEVELFREAGGWGSRLAPGSGVEIITGYDHERFVATLLA